LEGATEESENVKIRRKLMERASVMLQSAYQVESKSWFKWLAKRKSEGVREEAFRLLREADPDSIEPLSTQLRTEMLKPAEKFDHPQSGVERVAIVERLSEKRAALLQTAGGERGNTVRGLAGGGILLYAPDENLRDGAAKYSSKGFFDIDNIPPWDSWVCFHERHLVSWVPPALIDLANAGIDVNPEQCIQWADDSFVDQVFGHFA
jgi:hypothetical protein